MKKIIFVILLSVIGKNLNAQNVYCSVTVFPDDTTVCIGDTVYIQSISYLVNGGQWFSFNNGLMPSGWSATGGTNFSTPCGQNSTGTSYFWAQTTGVTPQITTASYDVSCGGNILFDMKFAIQGQPSPCEGPDEADEGISLQYSTNGTTWNNIIYYSPGGYTLPQNPLFSSVVTPPGGITPYTSWSSFNVPIPVAAQSTTTKFRWIQLASSSSANDNWGLDNIVINSSGVPCGSTTDVMWNQNPILNQDNFYYVAQQDTQFVCYVYDTLGVYHCQSSAVNINVIICSQGSIDEQSETFFQLSPNPVNDVLALTIPDGEILESVKIYNAMGQEVFAHKTNVLLIDVAQLENGFYTIELEINDKHYAKRFVKV
jgi:hypothetical protein